MRVPIEALRDAATKLFDHLAASGVGDVEVPSDYYWSIPVEKRYNPYEEPKELTLGQLSSDLAEIQRIVSGEADCVGYALVWLGSLCQSVGENSPV